MAHAALLSTRILGRQRLRDHCSVSREVALSRQPAEVCWQPKTSPRPRAGSYIGLRCDDLDMMRIKDVFPQDDPAARFVLSMWAVRNDLEYLLGLVGRANEGDAPEFNYLVRLSMAHLFEGAAAIRFYRDTYLEVEALLRKLPKDGQLALRKAQNAPSQIGGKALVQARIHTFHYPSPDPTYTPSSDAQLQEVLQEDAENEFEPPRKNLSPFNRAFLPTADMLMLRLAMAKHETADQKKLRQQITKTMEATTALRNVALRVWETYCRERQITL